MYSYLAMANFFIKVSLWIALIGLVQMHGYKSCLENERMALQELKAFFRSISNQNVDDILTSWVYEPLSDCCGWERVKCNGTTGRIIELSLNSVGEHTYDFSDGFPLLNMSLFSPFEELQSLDLSDNFFKGCYQNEGSDNLRRSKQLKTLNLGYNSLNDSSLSYLTSLTSLTTLILEYNNMVEVFKSNRGLGNLRKLELLNLQFNKINGSLSSEVLSNLKRLKFLDLNDNSISGSPQGICELKNLLELDISRNYFDGELPYCFCSMTNHHILDLSSNELSGKLPSCIANLTSLQYLSFAENNFEGLFSFDLLANLSKLQIFQLSSSMLQVENETVPTVPRYQLKPLSLRNCNLHAIPNFLLSQYDLRFIDLSHNKVFGDFPTWLLENNTKLETMYLINNSLLGILQLSDSKHDLHYLDISKNKFTGWLPSNIGEIFTEILELKMSKNSFEGSIPSSMGEMKRLKSLDLSRNNFSGELPRQFVTGCFSLYFLRLSGNNFEGKVFPRYMNLTNLGWLYLDNHHFSGEIQDGLLKANWLLALDLSSNMLSGQIPHWIGKFSNLELLSVSHNLFKGNIPIQLNNLQSLGILDISENGLSESMPLAFNLSSLQHLYMHKNAFSGSIPNALQRSSRLITLDLRDNQFSGSIPSWMNKYPYLRILLLRGNYLQGNIPNQLCQLRELSILDLSYNKLNGSIPACFTNMKSWMHGYDRGWLWLTDTWLRFGDLWGSYYNSTLQFRHWEEEDRPTGQQAIEFTTKNRYESYEGNILNYMTGMDLSCNELTGDIPLEIGNLQEVRALNFSHNCLSGSIPDSFSNLKKIESLDLSHNRLSGQIPPQLTRLNFLSNFNVSYNNLSGPTPNVGQFANFDERNYRGNPSLCGATINKSCKSVLDSPITPSSVAEEDECIVDMVSFCWSFAASYVALILGLFFILWVNSYWRRIWFYFVDAFIDSFFYWVLKYVF